MRRSWQLPTDRSVLLSRVFRTGDRLVCRELFIDAFFSFDSAKRCSDIIDTFRGFSSCFRFFSRLRVEAEAFTGSSSFSVFAFVSLVFAPFSFILCNVSRIRPCCTSFRHGSASKRSDTLCGTVRSLSNRKPDKFSTSDFCFSSESGSLGGAGVFGTFFRDGLCANGVHLLESAMVYLFWLLCFWVSVLYAPSCGNRK